MKMGNDSWSGGEHMPMARFSLNRSEQLLCLGHTLTLEESESLCVFILRPSVSPACRQLDNYGTLDFNHTS